MEQGRFTIVFNRLSAALTDEGTANGQTIRLREEIDEIAELRKIVLEISDPEPASYTTT